MMIRTLLMSVSLLASSVALAVPVPPAGMGGMGGMADTTEDDPVGIVRRGMQKLLAFMHSDDAKDKKKVAEYLEREVAPYFDFAYMSRWIAGPAYRNMTPSQRQALQQRLKRQFLGALSQRLSRYDNQQIRVFRPYRSRRNEVKVSVGILQPGTYPSKIDFRFYRSRDGWKVFDVAANGSSALVHYRRAFARSLRQRAPWMRQVRY